MNALVLYGVAGLILGLLTHVIANPASVVVVNLKNAMLNERQICSPGVIKCKNSTLTCSHRFVCEYILTPTPSYTVAMHRVDSFGNVVRVSPTPSRTPTPSPITSAMAEISPFITECNSCIANIECISGKCHNKKCIRTGSQKAHSLHKCFGISLPTPSAKASAMPVIFVW